MVTSSSKKSTHQAARFGNPSFPTSITDPVVISTLSDSCTLYLDPKQY